jgi:hypothetical protein
MPAQDRIGCHDGGNLRQHSTSQQLTFDGQATVLIVVEKYSLLTQLLFEYLIFCDQILDCMLLMAIDPA